MALKDWRRYAIVNIGVNTGIWVITFKKNNSPKFLKILKLHPSLRRRKPWAVTNKAYDRPYLKQFKTKSQALKYARAYMRKH